MAVPATAAPAELVAWVALRVALSVAMVGQAAWEVTVPFPPEAMAGREASAARPPAPVARAGWVAPGVPAVSVRSLMRAMAGRVGRVVPPVRVAAAARAGLVVWVAQAPSQAARAAMAVCSVMAVPAVLAVTRRPAPVALAERVVQEELAPAPMAEPACPGRLVSARATVATGAVGAMGLRDLPRLRAAPHRFRVPSLAARAARVVSVGREAWAGWPG